MEEHLKELDSRAKDEIETASRLEDLKEIRVKYLGKKGSVTGVLSKMGELSPEKRPVVGKLANSIKNRLQELIEEKEQLLQEELEEKRLQEEQIDISLPGERIELGHIHPLTRTINEVEEIFLGLGFEIAEGPEVETEYHNFVALNIPPDHPARDMQDTFYFSDELLLRTQTSPVQVRVMEEEQPPIRIIAPGKVYRCDADITHSPMFHQVEGLYIDRGVSFSDLKGVLRLMVSELFGGRAIRFRPSYFPFTEPSAEVDVSCIICDGEGCRICSSTGWLEILGAGMVHPRVLEVSGIDPEEVSGFAFGMGIERIAMLKFGIDDIRVFFDNDVRFINQF